MSRQDFVTESADIQPGRYDGSGERDRMDLTSYLTRYGCPYPTPSGTILVVDPAFVPNEVLVELLALSSGDSHPAIVTDQAFEWNPPPWMSDFEFRVLALGDNDWCGVCRTSVEPGGMDLFWQGRPVCDGCSSDEMKEEQRRGYEYANACAERAIAERANGWDRPDFTAWREGLEEFAAAFNSDRSRRW